MNTFPLQNREYSWLEFNTRILSEAARKENPLLERIKFLSIVSSNLDEFFMIRVAILKNKKSSELNLSSIRRKVLEIKVLKQKIFKQEIIPALKTEGIVIITDLEDLKPYEKNLESFFENNIKPLLTPISSGLKSPFINLVSGRLYLAIKLKPTKKNSIEKSHLSFIEIPTIPFGRFYRIPKSDIYIPIELIIRLFLKNIFPGYKVISNNIIKITRDAELDIQEDVASDLLKEIESTIKQMHRRSIVKLDYETETPNEIIKIITQKNNIDENDTYNINGLIHMKDLIQLYNTIDRKDLKFNTFNPILSQDLRNNIFDIIKEKDILLFHPYHSFDPVVELVNKAAEDPSVLAIKQTLYRTGEDSEIIQSLIRAAENGKYVTVIDELKARFDEKRNIEWARKLEDAGAHVTYGVAGLKTHAKALLIIRKERGRIRRYVHLSTGNYNEVTARIYSDFGFFTADEKITQDISSFFNLLTGFSLPEKWNSIAIAPTDLRKKFIQLIKREIENAKNGYKAKIIAKMNSLTDTEIIQNLYEASRAGVLIKLIVRGICSLIPGIRGVSENISVFSIVGRFLEHSRVFYFYNGGNDEYYLSSADWMERNLDRRVEILFPILDKENKLLIEKILQIQSEDNFNRWKLNSDSSYERVEVKKDKKDCFKIIYNYIKNLEEKKDIRKKSLFVPVKKR